MTFCHLPENLEENMVKNGRKLIDTATKNRNRCWKT